MHKIKQSYCYFIMLLSFWMAFPIVAGAADNSSHTNLTLLPGKGANEVVDPEQPEQPVQPIEPIQPNDGGPLTIDYASQWKFANQKITNKNARYFAQFDQMTDKQETAAFLQVTDKRGTFAGWKVSVTQMGQFETNAGQSLDGAQLTLRNMALDSTVLDREGGQQYQPNYKKEATPLTIGEKQVMMDASVGTGIGTWSMRFGNQQTNAKESVSLDVPGRTVKLAQTYTTKIVWSLENTPTNGENEE